MALKPPFLGCAALVSSWGSVHQVILMAHWDSSVHHSTDRQQALNNSIAEGAVQDSLLCFSKCVRVFLEPVVGKSHRDLDSYLLKLPEDPCLISRAVIIMGFGLQLLNFSSICAASCLTLS